MVAKLPRSIASAGMLGALLVAAAAPHLALAHTHALHAHRHVPTSMAPRHMPAPVAVVIRGNVFVIRADGRARRRLTGDRHATSPQLSPTQRQVAYVDTSRSHNGASRYLTAGDVWVVAVDSLRARRLTAAPIADLATPSWSPDGRRLAFYAGTAVAVCVVATDRCTSVLRSSHGARWDKDATIAWSPDGRRIAVALPYTGTYYPHVMRLAIGNVVNGRVTTSTIRFPRGALGRAIPPGSYPSGDGLTWRPDGHSLVFATLDEGAGPPNVTGIWQVADSGGSAHLLIGTAAGVREDALAAAEAGADATTQGVTLPRTRTTTSVGGLPAVRLRGLPGAPDFGQEIVVAHGGLLYGIYTFDNSRQALTPGQRQALASLRFIPRTGPALRPYGANALVAALYNPCLDIQRTAPAAVPVAVRFRLSVVVSPARGNEMVAANVTGTGFRPGQEMVLTACWNRAVHPTYAWYHKIAHVHANRYGDLPAPTVVPTFVMYVPSGKFRSWDVRVVATDARTGQRLAAVAVGPSAGAAGATTARG